MNHYIERTGHADGWNIVYYIFTFCRGILFFTVVVLIGTGWSYMVGGWPHMLWVGGHTLQVTLAWRLVIHGGLLVVCGTHRGIKNEIIHAAYTKGRRIPYTLKERAVCTVTYPSIPYTRGMCTI